MKNRLLLVLLLLVFLIVLTACTEIGAANTQDNTPYIGENGNWWIGTTDLGVSAQGPKGEQGEPGSQGVPGATGAPGTPVTVESVRKTKTEAAVDTYTIFFSDGTESSFTVTNGNDGRSIYITSVEKESSDGLTDSYKILFSDDSIRRFSVTNGASITIQSIGKTDTQGLVDTYQINFSDGKSLSFTVTNGADGLSPYIGANGNWWVGNEDLGVRAEAENMDRVGTDGLLFRLTIRGGVAGYEVFGYSGTDTDIVIPNEIFGQPVVSIASKDALPSNMTSLSISSNTEYLPSFSSRSSLQSFDFNHAPLTVLPAEMFESCSSLEHLANYENVTEIGTEAFASTALAEFDFSHITKIGRRAFESCALFDEDERLFHSSQYFEFIPETVTEIGNNAFDNDIIIYYAGTTALEYSSSYLFVGVKRTPDGYYYQDLGDSITVLNYDGEQTRIRIPETIDGKPVKTIANYGFFGNDLLERIEIPSSVTQIGMLCFSWSETIHSVFVPESVVSFGAIDEGDDIYYDYSAFEKPTFFFETNTIDFAGGVTSPNNLNIFKYLVGVTPAEIDDDECCVFYKKATSYEVVSIKNVAGIVTIPATHNNLPVSRINSNALLGLSKTRGVTIKNGITKIATNAFCSASNLLFVNVPSSVEIVNYRGFYSLSSCTVYIEAAAIPTDWDSSWYSSIKTYVLNAQANYSANGDYLYTISDQKLYLVKYLKTVATQTPIVIPEEIDGKSVYGIRSNCFEGTASNNSSNRYEFVVPSSISVIESSAIYLSNYGYSKLYLDIASSGSIPSGWDNYWFDTSYGYRYNSGYNYLYYSGDWELINGVPVAN